MVVTTDRARLLLRGQLIRADCKSVASLGNSVVQSVRVSVLRSASQAAAKAALESGSAPTKQHAAAKVDQPEPRSMDNLHEAESSTSGRPGGVEGTWSTLFEQMMERSKTRPRSNTTTEAFKIPKPYPELPALGLDGVGYQFLCERQQQRLDAYRDGLSRDPKKMVTLPIMSKSELEMRQLNMEAFSVDWALEKRRKGMEAIKNTTSSLPRTGRAMIQDWYTQLTAAVLEEQNKVVVKEDELGTDPNLLKVEKTLAAYRRFHAPYLHLLSPEALAGITINCVVRRLLQDGGRIRVGRTAANVGTALMHEVNFLKARDQTKQVARLRKEIGLIQQVLAADGLSADDETPEAVDRQVARSGRTKELQDRLFLLEEQLKKVLVFGQKLARIQTLWAAAPDRINSLTRIALADQAEDWGLDTTLKVGTVMLQLLLCTARVPPDSHREAAGAAAGVAPGLQPASDRLALQHILVAAHAGPKLFQRGYINCSPKALEMLHLEEEELRDLVQPVYQPMLLPPVPWTRYNRGGHLSLRTCVVRSSFPAQLQLLREADANMEAAGGRGSGEGLDQVYTALDVLGRQSWSINKEVLHVVEELRERTEGTWVDLPRKHDLPLPLPPKLRFRWVSRWESGEQAAALRVWEPTKRELRAWEKACRMTEQGNREQYSLRCDLQYKLDVARRFLNDRIYFPHNCDFRGRAYPLHPHLHHLGNDACRGLLRFGTGRPLGPQGLRWLKLHLANVYGHGWDKLSLSGRIDTVQQNLEVVLDSAQRPLDGFRWWMGAEAPFQCLAACLELRDALASPDPERFVSFLPVHQDGSCNGMQHYAALGRDLEGGRAVSLLDAEQPSDVYSTVARRVQAQVEQDASRGVPEAEALVGQVDRKLVKQTVMTTVYGVTFVGARRQIEDRLRERGWQHERMHQVASYAAKVTLRGLKESFRNADKIMDWLAQSARAIAKDEQFVKWTSPVGLPIVQPYTRKKVKSVKTVLQHLQVWDVESDLQVHKMSQKTAFPPNYIHSIDSSHMMMTALACEAAGVAFAGVHDSYWTHAGSVEQMNSILRDTFIDLHSQPLLQNLKEEFTREYKGVNFADLPETGSLNLESIREARYFFS